MFTCPALLLQANTGSIACHPPSHRCHCIRTRDHVTLYISKIFIYHHTLSPPMKILTQEQKREHAALTYIRFMQRVFLM
jgi:hypothetical protein